MHAAQCAQCPKNISVTEGPAPPYVFQTFDSPNPTQPPIDKLYTQISNVFRLCLIIESFSVMFWALGIVLAHILKQLTQPAGLASLNSGTGRVLYGRGKLGSI